MKKLKRITGILKKAGLIAFIVLILALSIRGVYGNPNDNTLNSDKLTTEGPFELSPERGRFALTYSLIENKSFYFSVPVAKFVLPDLGYKNGHYVSLFAPAVSYLVMPGYVLGKAINISQVGAFAIISLFSVFNFLLIIAICERLGLGKRPAVIAAVTFLFASPAFSYAVTLYQHHISTFLILSGIYLLLKSENVLSTALIMFLAAASIPVDYPNLFLMFPVALAALIRNFSFKKYEKIIKVSVKAKGVVAILGVIIPLLFFLWFNQKSYGNPLQFSGTIPSVRAIDESGNPDVPKNTNLSDVEKFVNPNTQKKSALTFFKPRQIVNGLYTHLISPDRGIIVFTPIAILGLIGFAFLYKKDKKTVALLLSIVSINLVLYSMWGDPWGGWAFGSRYMIPSYALTAIGLAAFINYFATNRNFSFLRRIIYFAILTILLLYSIFVNTVGSLTTSSVPPQVEAQPLESVTNKNEYFNYMRGIEMLNHNNSKSFLFKVAGNKYLTAWQYFGFVYGLILIFTLANITLILTKDRPLPKIK